MRGRYQSRASVDHMKKGWTGKAQSVIGSKPPFPRMEPLLEENTKIKGLSSNTGQVHQTLKAQR